jgi:hypothetical protein
MEQLTSTHEKGHPNHLPETGVREKVSMMKTQNTTDLQLCHQRLYSSQKFPGSVMSYRLLIEPPLQGKEKFVKFLRFDDRPVTYIHQEIALNAQ